MAKNIKRTLDDDEEEEVKTGKAKRTPTDDELKAFLALNKFVHWTAPALRKHPKVVKAMRELHAALSSAVKLETLKL